MEIPVPDDADAIYLGTSHGDGNYKAIDLGNGWLKIERVFATHAIMHITKRFTESVICWQKVDLRTSIDLLMLELRTIFNKI